jgi:hypothetical protein
MAKPNGFTAYRGPSLLDGVPIVSKVTGTQRPSDNPKTGPMLQQFVLVDGVKPTEALKTGQDESVCGDCAHRPFKIRQIKEAHKQGLRLEEKPDVPCYLAVFMAPTSVWKTEYPDMADVEPSKYAVRLGAYGNPDSVPIEVNRAIIAMGNGRHTGYTHNWRTCDQAYAEILMASVDSEAEALEAQAMGWRRFRVRGETEPLMEDEVACPASKESGYRTTCARCGLCSGNKLRAKSVAIIEH